jgi:hypothetical protein
VLACTALAIRLVWPAFEPGRIVNLDAPRHLLRTHVMAGQFLPSGHVDGWSPWWYLGAQLFLFQSYGYFLLMAGAFHLIGLLGGAVPLETVFKVFYVLTIVALPAATAWMARRLGASHRAAALAALASLSFSSHYGYGIRGVFHVGLLLQGAGVLVFAIVWPLLLGAIIERRRRPWPAALATGLLLLVHFISGAYALAAAGCVAAGVALVRREIFPLWRLALVAVVAVLLAGHSLLPSLEWRELAGVSVGWGDGKGRVAAFFQGELFGARPLALAALAGAAMLLLRRSGGPLAITAMVMLATAAVAGSDSFSWEPAPLKHLLHVLARPRALPYAGLFLALFAGVAVDAFLRWVEDLTRRRRWHPAVAIAVAAVVLVATAHAGWSAIRGQRVFVRTESMIAEHVRAPYTELARWLRENVQAPAIVAVPRNGFPRHVLGSDSVISLLNLDTGLFTLGGDQADLTRAGRRLSGGSMTGIEKQPDAYVRSLRACGVSYLVATDPEVRTTLLEVADLEKVHEWDAPVGAGAPRPALDRRALPVGFTVFRVHDSGVWLRGQGITVRRFHHGPESMRWAIDAEPGQKPAKVIFAVNWHPNWKAFADGQEIGVEATADDRIVLHVDRGTRWIELRYVRSAREKLWNALSALTLLLVLGAMARGRLAGA